MRVGQIARDERRPASPGVRFVRVPLKADAPVHDVGLYQRVPDDRTSLAKKVARYPVRR